MEIIRFVNSVFESNTYLIKEEQGNRCCLVDCGDTSSIIGVLQSQELELISVFITHSHFDHIYGLNKLTSYAPSIKVYISLHGQEGLLSDKLNISRYHSSTFIYRYEENVEVIKGGQKIPLFGQEGVSMWIHETPGHDWSSLCYKVGNAFFSGDSYLPQYSLVANFPKSNKKQALESLERIRELSVGCNIYPGHGDIVYV